MDRIKELEEKITTASNAYYNGSQIIDDDEYDASVYELSCLDPKNILLVKVGSEPTTEWIKEKHLTPLGSLNKVNTEQEIKDWILDKLNGQSVLVSEKMDGLSVGLQYLNSKLIKGPLRGNAYEGENIYSNLIKMNGIVTHIPNFTGTIRAEIVLTKTNHKKYFPEYSNPRNSASGLCRKLDSIGCEYLTIYAHQIITDDDLFSTEYDQFEFLKKNGFTTPNYKVCNTTEEVCSMYREYQSSIRDTLDYEIDGLVVTCNDLTIQQSMGEADLRPKGKMALKFANQLVPAKIKDITWAIGNSGRITPICWFEPVNLLGSVVQKASVYNVANINKLGLDIGAEVLICKANEIIPKVERLIKGTGSIAKPPITCPECGAILEETGENLQCPNVDFCPAQIKGRLINWVTTLDIKEWGPALIDQLVDNDIVNDISDLYSLDIETLSSVERMGAKSAKKCIDLLNANKVLTLDVFIGALSISLIGKSSIKLLVDRGIDTLDKLLDCSVERLENIPGFGPVRAQSLYDGLQKKGTLIMDLLDAGITIKEKVEGVLSGKSFCFTGSQPIKRQILENIVVEKGGIVKNTCGKGTSYLVIADVNSTTSKAVSAKKLGVSLISGEDFLKMAGIDINDYID